MNLYFDFPYLSELKVTVKKRKTLKNKLHISTIDTIFCPHNKDGLPSDIGFFDDIPVSDVYVDNGEIFHVLEEKSKKNSFTQKLNIEHRNDVMQQYGAAVIYSLVFKKLLSLEVLNTIIDDEQMILSVELLDKSVNIIGMLTTVMDVVNSVIDNSLEIEVSSETDAYHASIATLGKIEIEAPIPSNTSEIKSTVITSYKYNDNQLDIYLLAGKRCMDYLYNRLSIVKNIRKLLNVDDEDVYSAVNELVEKSDGLNQELGELKNYVYLNYINELEILTYEIEEYSVFSHYVEDLDIVLEDFIELIPTDIALVGKNEGEYSRFCLLSKVEDFDISEVFEAVNEIYPFEFKSDKELYNGRILTQYLERFMDTFNKYLKEKLTYFIENPPTDEQLEIDDEELEEILTYDDTDVENQDESEDEKAEESEEEDE